MPNPVTTLRIVDFSKSQAVTHTLSESANISATVQDGDVLTRHQGCSQDQQWQDQDMTKTVALKTNQNQDQNARTSGEHLLPYACLWRRMKMPPWLKILSSGAEVAGTQYIELKMT